MSESVILPLLAPGSEQADSIAFEYQRNLKAQLEEYQPGSINANQGWDLHPHRV
jgi:hypothetical protein